MLFTQTRFILTMFLYPQQVGLLVLSILNAAISAACCIGLLLAISLTVSNNGQGLMKGCNDTLVPIDARSPVSARCPFDTTRIYVSFKVPLPQHHHLCSISLLPQSFRAMTFYKHVTSLCCFTVLHLLSGHHPGLVDPLCCYGSV